MQKMTSLWWCCCLAVFMLSYAETTAQSLARSKKTQALTTANPDKDRNVTSSPSQLPVSDNEETHTTSSYSTDNHVTSMETSDAGSEQSVGDSYLVNVEPFMQVICIVVGVVGTLDNAVVIWVMFKTKQLRKTLGNLFVINQSFIDLFGSLALFSYSYLNEPFNIPGDFAKLVFCKVWVTKWYLWAFFQVSTFNLTCMVLEKYMAVAYPFLHKRVCSKPRVIVVMVLCWILGFASEFAYVTTFSTYKDGICVYLGALPNPMAGMIIGWYVFIMQWALPVVAMAFASAKMVQVLRQSSLTSNSGGQGSSTSGNREVLIDRATRNIIKTLLIVYACYIICIGPNILLYLLFNYDTAIDVNAWYFHATVALVLINACINPVIYALKFEDFQKALKKMVFPKSEDGNLNLPVTSASKITIVQSSTLSVAENK